MLAMGGCPPLCALQNTSSSPHSQNLNLRFRRISQPHLPFLSSPQFFGFRVVFGRERIGFCVAARKRRKNAGTLLEVDGIGDEGDEWGDEDEDEFIPFPNMKRWAQNKPRGFGDGKVYDTRVEDKLLEEIEQSRVAQLANINKLKNNPVGLNSGKANNQERKAPETIANAFRVRVVNLPKKNIHRDLQLAFKGVPGIVNIIPAVSGNQKTRDPVCRGFAFVDLKTEDDANRFVHMFSKQSITFGKIQKQINCEMMDPGSPKVSYQQSAERTYTDPLSAVPSYDGSTVSEFDIDDSSLDVWEESGSGESDGPIDLEGGMASDLDLDITSLDTWQDTTSDESNALENEYQTTMEWEDVRENLESFSTSVMDDDDRLEPIMESATNSLSSRQLEEIWALEKKSLGKRREKVPKLKVQASELHDGDTADQRVGTDVDSSSSNSLENIQALERRLLARGIEWKVSKSNIHAAEQNFDDVKNPKQQATADSLVSKRVESVQELQRGPLVREKRETVPKSNILTSEPNGEHRRKQQKKKPKKKRGKAPVVSLPGSANRLKIKEKVVLTDVFSKYGMKTANTTKQEA